MKVSADIDRKRTKENTRLCKMGFELAFDSDKRGEAALQLLAFTFFIIVGVRVQQVIFLTKRYKE